MKFGDWFLMDNVNFCNLLVLDCLNVLFEFGGVFIISERGMIDGFIFMIILNFNFRFFFLMDFVYGDIF